MPTNLADVLSPDNVINSGLLDDPNGIRFIYLVMNIVYCLILSRSSERAY